METNIYVNEITLFVDVHILHLAEALKKKEYPGIHHTVDYVDATVQPPVYRYTEFALVGNQGINTFLKLISQLPVQLSNASSRLVLTWKSADTKAGILVEYPEVSFYGRY